MADPVPALTYAAVFAAYTAIIMGATASMVAFSNCNGGYDVVNGNCADVLDDLLGALVLGTVPNAPFEVNLLFGAIGLASRLTIIVWLIEKGGWVAVGALVAGVIAALVAWLT